MLTVSYKSKLSIMCHNFIAVIAVIFLFLIYIKEVNDKENRVFHDTIKQQYLWSLLVVLLFTIQPSLGQKMVY